MNMWDSHSHQSSTGDSFLAIYAAGSGDISADMVTSNPILTLGHMNSCLGVWYGFGWQGLSKAVAIPIFQKHV